MCFRSTAKTAIRLLEAFNRYLISGEGDVKQLQGKENELLGHCNYFATAVPRGGGLQPAEDTRHRGV